jgi:hypothetical protein
MSSFTTWVRVEDAHGQFDHPKGVDLPAGVSLVEDYPEHVGPLARESKAFVDKTGAPASRVAKSYDRQLVADLEAEIASRVDAGHVIQPAGTKKADLVAALVADDADPQIGQQTSDVTETTDTTNTSGDAAGSEN